VQSVKRKVGSTGHYFESGFAHEHSCSHTLNFTLYSFFPKRNSYIDYEFVTFYIPCMSLERLKKAWADHGRQFGQYQFVYPVVSRRAGGISLGINLNPDLNCNFDCPYCQVDRTVAPESLPIFSLAGLRTELELAVAHWQHNKFTDSPRFQGLADSQLDLKDFCMSGDGEPTMVQDFAEVCGLLAEMQQSVASLIPQELKLVLITNATLLHKDSVRAGLAILTQKNGEIWGKLDAGTEPWFKLMSRSRYTLDHIEANLTSTVRDFPLRVQTMLCTKGNQLPSTNELEAYATRLKRIVASNSKNLLEVQLYSIVRHTATDDVGPVPAEFLAETAAWLRTQVKVEINPY